MILFIDKNGEYLEYSTGNFTYAGRTIHAFKLSLWKKLRLFDRLLRLSPRLATKIDDRTFIVARKPGIYLLDFNTCTISELIGCREGFTIPLSFCNCNNSVYWGDYGYNRDRKEVNIYQYLNNTIKVIHTFKPGEVRHVHNIIYDAVHQRFWIFTGDTEKHAGIWLASNDFSEIHPLATGGQKYRAVIGFSTSEGIIYATDAVEEDNFIYSLQLTNNEEVKLTKLMPINGSCIYGTELCDYYIFSTTVEPHEGGGFFKLFSYELGSGIKNRNVTVIAVAKNDLSHKVIVELEKDWLPMKLFQYGSIQFPNGQNNSNELFYNVVACKGFDGKTLKLQVE